MLAQMRVTKALLEHAQHQVLNQGKQFVEAVDAGDLSAMLRMYDDDAELLAFDLPVCRGKQALRVYYETALKARLRFIERRPFEVTSSTPLSAIERGYYSIEQLGRVVSGRYFALWQRQSTGWRIVQECRHQ